MNVDSITTKCYFLFVNDINATKPAWLTGILQLYPELPAHSCGTFLRELKDIWFRDGGQKGIAEEELRCAGHTARFIRAEVRV
jgi:hypothetical protein